MGLGHRSTDSSSSANGEEAGCVGIDSYVGDVVDLCGSSFLIASVFCSHVGKRSCAKKEAQKYWSFEDF